MTLFDELRTGFGRLITEHFFIPKDKGDVKFGDLSRAPLSNTSRSSRTRFGHLRPSSLASGKPLQTEERASYDDNDSPAQHIRQTKSTSSFQDVPSCLNFYSVFKERFRVSPTRCRVGFSSAEAETTCCTSACQEPFNFFSKRRSLTSERLLGSSFPFRR